jgi:acyl-CoA synthetase (AMP-forming)/AMP-acid ligase II
MPLPEGRPFTDAEANRYLSFRERPHTLPGLLEWRATAGPAGPAFVAPDGSLTYAEWARAASRAAHVLKDAGARPNDRIGIWAPNTYGRAWAIAFLGIGWAGAVPVPMSPGQPIARVLESLSRLGASHLVVPNPQEIPTAAAIKVIDLNRLASGDDGPRLETPECTEQTSAGIYHTSGTTGAPKAAILSHGSVCYMAALTEEHILGRPAGIEQLGPGDVIQTSVPMHTTSALAHYFAVGLWSGCRLVCEDRFDAKSTVDTFAREQATVWLCVPSMMVLVGDRYDEAMPSSSLRVVWHMGSVATRESIEGIRRIFPKAACINLYSLTETGAGIISCTSDEAIALPGTVGRPVPSTRVRLVGPLGDDVPIGEVGEIWFDSPHMFDGYYGNLEATAATFSRDGWFRSGDGGYLDDLGLLQVTGRLGDVIVRGGFKINPVLVERALMTYNGILDAAVIGIPHRVLGQDLVAVVVADHAVSVERLREHCGTRLAHNEIPRTLIQLDALVRNDFGKLDRKALRALVSERLQSVPTTT